MRRPISKLRYEFVCAREGNDDLMVPAGEHEKRQANVLQKRVMRFELTTFTLAT